MTQVEMLTETWRIANWMTLLVLRAIPETALVDSPEKRGRSVGTMLAHLIAHRGNHHSKIGMVLTQAVHWLPTETAYGMWEWDKP